MAHPEWNDRHFIRDAARTRGGAFAKRMKDRDAERKAEVAGWKKGDYARFSNDVIGKVTNVFPTALEIRIGLGRPQKYSPKMVTKVERK